MTPALSLPDSRVRRLAGTARLLAPGLLACLVIALAAQFLSDHYGAPTLLLALLLLKRKFLFSNTSQTCVVKQL